MKEYIKVRSEGYESTSSDKENYKALLDDIPAYNTISKLKQGAEVAASIVGLLDAGLTITTPSIGALPTRLARVIPEENAGSFTLGRPVDLDVFVTTPGELKGLNAKGISEKLTLQDANGIMLKGRLE